MIMKSEKSGKNRKQIVIVLVLSTIVAFLFTVMVDKIPSLLDSVLNTRSKVNITENEDLVRVLKSGVGTSGKEYTQLTKLARLPYRPEDKYYVSSEMYESNIKYLAENGYFPITLKEFIKTIREGRQVSPKAVLIYSDTTSNWFYDIAFPILKKYKFTATIAVETNLINTPGHMSVTQLEEIEDFGIEISSHSISHPDLTTVDDKQLKKEIVESKQILAEWGFDVDTFVYPYGACNDRVIQAVKDAGYIGARSVGGPYLSNGGGYASYNQDCLYEIKAGLPVNTTTFDQFKEYVLNDKAEIEAICSLYSEAGNIANIKRLVGEEDDLKNDSFASIPLPDKGDAIKLTVYVPQAGDYNLSFRIKTGNYLRGGTSNTDENAYKYTIGGHAYTVSRGTVVTTGPYENEATTKDIVWGYQHINNVYLEKGANDIIVSAEDNWAILDYLTIQPLNQGEKVIPQIIPSIDYDGIFDGDALANVGLEETSVFLAMHGYDHQNPQSGSFADEFEGLSYNETATRIEKSQKIFSEMNLKPKLFIPPGGKTNDSLYKAAAENDLYILDCPILEVTWMWRDMSSFDDPRYTKALKELKKLQPAGILLHMQDYNKYTEKLLESYLKDRKSTVMIRVDDVNIQTSDDELKSLLDFRHRHDDKASLVLGVTPRFYKKQPVAFTTLFQALWILFLFSVVFSRIFFACLATADRFKDRKTWRKGVVHLANGGGLPKVSIVIPMFNEGEMAVQAIRCARNQSYPGPVEIIVMDDGSHDDTFEIIKSETLRHNNIIGVKQVNRGKPSALNSCVKAATGEIIVSTDGDSYLDEQAVEKIVERFLADPEVGAVAGFISVSNEEESWITRFSQIEYVIEQILFRGCQSFTGDVVICPGAIFAARRQLLIDNPSSHRTIVEDCDQTCLIRESGWKVVFAPDATSETKAPATMKGWINQRLRWLYGYLQVWRLMRKFAVKKPWMFYGYLGYPMTFLVFVALVIPIIYLIFYPTPNLLRDLSIYTSFGIAFTLGVYLYSIFVLAPKGLKKSTLPWLLLFPLYEMMVMVMRAYLYITYIRGDGPTMQYGPRTIHALPDRSVAIEDRTLQISSDEVMTGAGKDILLHLIERDLNKDQRSGAIRAMEDTEKDTIKKLLNLLIPLLGSELSCEQKREIICSLSYAEKLTLKMVLEETLNKSADTIGLKREEDPEQMEKDLLAEKQREIERTIGFDMTS